MFIWQTGQHFWRTDGIPSPPVSPRCATCTPHSTNAPPAELADLAGDLGELRALCAAQLVAVVADAEQRGLVEQSQCASTTAWVADRVWHCRREASLIAKTAKAVPSARPSRPVADAVLDADIDPLTAVVVAGEYDKLAPDLRDEAKPVVLEQFLTIGAEQGPAGVRRLKQEILARYGEDGEFEEHQQRCRRQIDLSPGSQTSPGVWDYRLTVDNEGRSVLEAAIGPLSAPAANPETGEPDPRPVGRRRGEALVEALRRSVTATGTASASPKAVLVLTMDYEALRAQIGAASALGSVAKGCLLGADTVRKLACDAAIVPTVLGRDGEILDQGREVRLFTLAQVRALWRRDGHCTFPGCDAPAAWSDAHHLIHWADGGPTDLGNACLLCPRHHTIVHRDRLAGVVTDRGVEWDRRPGSYQPPGPSPEQQARSGPDGASPAGRSAHHRPPGRTDPARPTGSDPVNRARPSNPATDRVRRS